MPLLKFSITRPSLAGLRDVFRNTFQNIYFRVGEWLGSIRVGVSRSGIAFFPANLRPKANCGEFGVILIVPLLAS